MKDADPIAIASVTAYIQLGEGTYPNLTNWDATDDPDEYADDLQRELCLPDGITWQYRNGDDLGDGLTSYTYFGTLTTDADLTAVLDYAGSSGDDGDLNMGLLTGPEEYGYIPCGRTYSHDGMDWNVGGLTRIAGAEVAVFPLTLEVAETLGLVAGDES